MIRAAFCAAVTLALAGCGGAEPEAPAAPTAEELQVLSEAAEMLPDETPSAEVAETPAD
ncbi:hypothetical protein [Croceicoccus naphthovorans]|uniref:hypothetical protein n=1 Tax=Croceicoccus naphthovorans TaxID=1348774 RepID=UPI000A552A07|nr:hypothetical protein [Croceicoccus naphthovorans]MBB3989842.1 nitrous oxide reductase accessory protein NosL [Croceicoccus naphthovorans]